MRIRGVFLATIGLAIGVLAPSASAQQVIFVDRDRPPGGNGMSWQTAYRSLQDALAQINPLASGGTVDFWIADGVYRPDQGVGLTLGDRTLSFELEDGDRLLGGFNGTETLESQRDPSVNVVILNGDLNQDDAPGFTNIGDNSHHVVTTCFPCTGEATLDGLTIRGGNTDGAISKQGAGVRSTVGLQLSIVDCILDRNSADNGGAIVAINTSMTIQKCTITGNRGLNNAGGLWAVGSAAVTITDTNFSVNTSPGHDVVGEFGTSIFGDSSDLESVQNLGTIGAGDDGTAGELSTSSTYQQENGMVTGVMKFDIGGVTPATEHDRVDISAEANLRGVAQVELIGNYMPAGPETFELLQSGLITNDFDVALLPWIDNGLTMQLSHLGSQNVEVSLRELGTVLSFAPPQQAPFAGQATDVALGDFDGDTFVEAAMSVPDPGGGAGEAVILVNDGSFGGVWSGFGTVVAEQVGSNPVAIAIADLDGDLVNDIVVANYDDDTVSVLINNQDLQGVDPFTRTDYSTGGSGPVDVTTGDTDMMNGVDIIVANESGEVTVLANNGDGTFGVAAVLDEPGLPGTVDPSDFDNDKDLDIIISDNEAGSILVAENVGDNTFEFSRDFPVGSVPFIAAADDLNGDMQDDLLGLVPDLGILALVLNEGLGSFGPVMYVPVGGDAQSMAVADMDNDGDADVAVVVRDGVGGRVIQILRNDTSGGQLTYTLAQQIGQEEAPLAVVAGDVDNDSLVDLVSPATPAIPLAGGGNAFIVSRLSDSFVPCAADADANGVIDVTDLLAVLSTWGPCGAPCPTDTDHSGAVDVTDLLAVLSAWGDCP